MWTTLTSSGDAVTFDSHSKTPRQLLLKGGLSSIQIKNSSGVEMQVINWCFNYINYPHRQSMKLLQKYVSNVL